jgi:hypothetical protein
MIGMPASPFSWAIQGVAMIGNSVAGLRDVDTCERIPTHFVSDRIQFGNKKTFGAAQPISIGDLSNERTRLLGSTIGDP